MIILLPHKNRKNLDRKCPFLQSSSADACIAQLVERITRNDEVTSSTLVAGYHVKKTGYIYPVFLF